MTLVPFWMSEGRSRVYTKTVALIVVLGVVVIGNNPPLWCVAYEICGGDKTAVNSTKRNGDGRKVWYCPAGNTCCRMAATGGIRDGIDSSVSWGCIASDMGAKNATCCTDDIGESNTGCPAGYQCRRRESWHRNAANGSQSQSLVASHDCFLAETETGHYDPLMQVLPRYRLCRAEASNQRLYGLPVSPSLALGDAKEERGSLNATGKLAYYSNLGPIDDRGNYPLLSGVEMALVVVHGANRNGDDYFCSAKATIDLQHRFGDTIKKAQPANGSTKERRILVVAPVFLPTPSPTGDLSGASQGGRHHPLSFLFWDEAGDRDGSWRYGADASGPLPGISSYDAMDAIVLNLRRSGLFPNLRRIALVGHSSGGQLVQRWSLLTPSEVWPPPLSSSSPTNVLEDSIDSASKPKIKPRRLSGTIPVAPSKNDDADADSSITIHAVVANPSNYVYFTPLRFFNDNNGSIQNRNRNRKNSNEYLRRSNNQTMQNTPWRLPFVHQNGNDANDNDDNSYENCPFYNRWEYGLDDGGPMDVPYLQRAIARDSKSRLVDRYLTERSVSYLVGDLDRCDGNQPCESHGLETTCADELQGRNRYERNARYMASLRLGSGFRRQRATDHTRDGGFARAGSSSSARWTSRRTNASDLISHHHRRAVVPNVGHDHAMMFQSEQGIEAIYYARDTEEKPRIRRKSLSEKTLS
ncbi:unnamed protein product [Pseudo-nitzschia multistriata]|uniref:Uncharacterized protein n=1 Tax=Pseudo-nitzschia multistriata TaxID=183589 RepID=A0A448YYC8_9STRA|nr:unnamed protein product [Pseudo-nitzschia multistriata]